MRFAQRFFLATGLCLGLLFPVQGEFRIYETTDLSLVQKSLGISDQCMQALNMAIDCDRATATKAAAGPDSYYWHTENVTALCTELCRESLASWKTRVETECGDETIIGTGGMKTLAMIVPTMWKEGFDLVCLQSSGSDWCFLDSQEWQGADYIRYSPDACDNADPTNNPSQCGNSTWSTQEITHDMMDVTKMYNRSLFCSECFIKIWRQRLLSPLHPRSDHGQYLLNQYENIQRNCSADLPVTTYAPTLLLPTPTSGVPTTISPSAAATCLGQLVEPSGLTCAELSSKHNVSSGSLVQAAGNEACQFTQPICLPLPCEIDVVYDGVSCEELASRYSSGENEVSLTQFLAWNPSILGSCGMIRVVQRVCKGPPGGRYIPSGVIYAPTAAGSYYSTAHPSQPTQSGTTASCGRYYSVVAGDTCNSVALRFGISFAELQSLNTFLNDACTNLWLQNDICVAPVSTPPLSTDGRCGPSYGNTICEGTGFGDCCSTGSWCGSTGEYCGAGNCISGACDSNDKATADGTCGPEHAYMTCTNPNFGPCCSIYGYCGDGDKYCGAGFCYSGKCEPDIGGPSVNGECGPNFAGNKTCTGTQFGACCSISGYCGNTEEYCGVGNCYSGSCL